MRVFVDFNRLRYHSEHGGRLSEFQQFLMDANGDREGISRIDGEQKKRTRFVSVKFSKH